jgi:hypothetical protein
MHKVALMDPVMGPPKCLICNRGNTPDAPDQMNDFWVMDLERDVNWGDPAYICKYCCEDVASQTGYVPQETIDGLESTIRAKNKDIHRLEADLDSLRRRWRAAGLGKKALRSARGQLK